MRNLELGLIGNSAIAALIGTRGEIVWACFPRFDGDASSRSLLHTERASDDVGFCTVELVDQGVQRAAIPGKYRDFGDAPLRSPWWRRGDH